MKCDRGGLQHDKITHVIRTPLARQCKVLIKRSFVRRFKHECTRKLVVICVYCVRAVAYFFFFFHFLEACV